MLEAVIFDLVPYQPISLSGMESDCGPFEASFDEHVNARLRRLSRMDSLEIMLERSKRTYTHRAKEELEKNQIYQSLLQKMTYSDLEAEASSVVG